MPRGALGTVAAGAVLLQYPQVPALRFRLRVWPPIPPPAGLGSHPAAMDAASGNGSKMRAGLLLLGADLRYVILPVGAGGAGGVGFGSGVSMHSISAAPSTLKAT